MVSGRLPIGMPVLELQPLRRPQSVVSTTVSTTGASARAQESPLQAQALD